MGRDLDTSQQTRLFGGHGRLLNRQQRFTGSMATALAAIAVVSAACHPRRSTPEDAIAALRLQVELAAGVEQMVGETNVTYEEVENRWRRVRAEYEKLLKQFPEKTDELQSRIAIIDQRIALVGLERNYSARIEMHDLQRTTGTRKHFGTAAEGIVGEVKNTGDKVVTTLELRFELLDTGGRPVGEDDYTVTFPGGTRGPIKPNYTVPFGTVVENPPSDWVSVRGTVRRLTLSREGLLLPEEREE
jgi:hypothetical protein